MLKFKWVPFLSITGVLALLAGIGPLANAEDKKPTKEAFQMQKASDLIGKSVENAEGEKLGEVQDLAIDPDRSRVAYIVLSHGGILGVGDKWFAVPTRAMTLPGHAKNFVLAVEKDQLKNATGFDKDSWPQSNNIAWGVETHKHYGQKPYWMDDGDGATPSDLRLHKASEVIGRSVQNDRGEELGEITDLVIDTDRARIAYAVLSFGGVMGLGDKLFAIPASALQMPEPAEHAVLEVEKDQLKSAPGFDKNNWPNLADPTLATNIYEFYHQRPYWTEDLRGGEYLTSAAGKACHHCSRMTAEKGFVRDGNTFCCVGCANKTGCTCGPAKSQP